MVVLDTNIIIDHLRQPQSKQTLLLSLAKNKPKETLALSVISIQELYEGQSTKDKTREQALLATITPLKILPYTYEIAQLAGEIVRDLPAPIELADAAIAATAIYHGAILCTLNPKDFSTIKQLEFFNPPSRRPQDYEVFKQTAPF